MAVALQLGRVWIAERIGVDPFSWAIERLKFKQPERAREFLMLLTLLVSIVVIWIGWAGVELVIAQHGPHEGDELFSPPLELTGTFFVEKDLTENAELVSAKPMNVCSFGLLSPEKNMLSDDDLDVVYQKLVRWVSLDKNVNCIHHGPNDIFAVPAFDQKPRIVDKAVLDQVRNGQEYLYMFVLERFALDENPNAQYIQEICKLFVNRVEWGHDCPGKHNHTYRHIVQ